VGPPKPPEEPGQRGTCAVDARCWDDRDVKTSGWKASLPERRRLESTRSLIDQDRGPRHLDQSLQAPQPGLGGRVTGYPHARQVAEACLSAKGTLPGHSEFQGARSSVSSWKAPCNPSTRSNTAARVGSAHAVTSATLAEKVHGAA